MAENLKIEYDRIGDILYITKIPPYLEQETEEIEDEILARLNPETGAVEGLEILFWSKRLAAGEVINLPIDAQMRLTVEV